MLRLLLSFAFFVGSSVATLAAPPPEADVTHSASLQGAKVWEDASPADLNADSTYVLPGAFHVHLTLDNLRRRFGAANVTLGKVAGAEGEEFDGIILFDGDPQRRAEIYYADDAHRRGIGRVRVSGDTSRWHFDNGLRLGVTLGEIVAKNGAPISYTGLDWDYGGTITDWHGGRMQHMSDGPTPKAIGLAHGDVGDGDDDSGIPTGDRIFRSDDKKYAKALSVLYVGELSVSFDESR